MAERKYRAQILLEPEQHEVLTEIAQQQGRSISNVVREIVGQYIVAREQTMDQEKEALERVKQHRAEMLSQRGGHPLEINIPAMIEEIREERSNDLLTNILARGD